MGFLGFTLLLLPIGLPLYIIDILINNPEELATFFSSIPEMISGIISALF